MTADHFGVDPSEAERILTGARQEDELEERAPGELTRAQAVQRLREDIEKFPSQRSRLMEDFQREYGGKF